MRRRFGPTLTTLAATAWILTAVATGPAVRAQARMPYGPIPVDCDRACLEGLVDQYLAAVVAHAQKRLPLSADVRYTENDQVMPVGNGFWGTATAIGGYRQIVANPTSGQVGFLGSMREGNNPLLFTLRLKVQLGRITEIETTYFRQGGGGPNDIAGLDKSTPEPWWKQANPTGQRAARIQLTAVANAYFEGVQANDGKGYYPFADTCLRRENGMLTASAPPNKNLAPGAFDAFALPCKKQLESGYYAVATRIHSRRLPIVDEERGLVWSYAMFDMNGTVREITLTTGQKVSMANFNRPSGIEVTEIFRIENGLIRGIEMVGGNVPYHSTRPGRAGRAASSIIARAVTLAVPAWAPGTHEPSGTKTYPTGLLTPPRAPQEATPRTFCPCSESSYVAPSQPCRDILRPPASSRATASPFSPGSHDRKGHSNPQLQIAH